MKKVIFFFSFLIIFVFSLIFVSHKKQDSKVYDCFLFFNELDLLEIRLNELNDVVDYFVIVENPLTFSGKSKTLYFQENKQKFEKYLNKIIYVSGKKRPEFTNPWDRETSQRNDILLGLTKAKDNDIVIISDLDEIIRSTTVQEIKNMLLNKQKNKKRRYKYVKIEQNQYRYYLNRVFNDDPLWARAMATTYKQVKAKTPQKLRENIYNIWPIIKNGGWHFSFLGNIENIRYKIESYSHQEFNNDTYKSETNLFDLIEKCTKIEIDKTFPKIIVDNLSYYKNINYIDEN